MHNQKSYLVKPEKKEMLQFLLIASVSSMLLVAGASPAYALYLADSQTVTTTKNTPVTFYLTGSAPVDFYYRVLTHPNVADTCTDGYLSSPPTCEHGYMEYDGATGQVWYTPNKDFVGTDSFTFETVAEMGPWSGDGIGVITIVVTDDPSAQIETTVIGTGSEIIQGSTYKANDAELDEIEPMSSNIASWQMILHSLDYCARSLIELGQSILDFFTK
jgi:hypothetical protein